MKMRTGTIMALLVLLAGCSQPPSESAGAPAADTGDNPLLSTWDTPHGVPPFDKIQDDHYLPALRESMALQKVEIEAITGNPEEPTFANTIEALERACCMLQRVNSVFSAVNGAHSSEITREAATEIAPELSAHGDDISMHADLFARVNAVYAEAFRNEPAPARVTVGVAALPFGAQVEIDAIALIER